MIDRRFLNIGFTIIAIANSPTQTPVQGEQYIVGSAGEGDFSDIPANYIARYNNSAWEFTEPRASTLEVLNTSTGDILRYNGAAWITVASISNSSLVLSYTTGTILGVLSNPAGIIPQKGDQFIVGDSPAGDFSQATTGAIAVYNGEDWSFITPVAGEFEFVNINNGQILRYTSNGWECIAQVSLAGNVRSIEVIDKGTEAQAIGDNWDFSDVRVLAHYSRGYTTEITGMCSFSPAQGTIITDEELKQVTVSFTDIGGTVSNTFTRQAVGNNSFLKYFNCYTNYSNNNLYLVNFNSSQFQSDYSPDINIYSTVLTGNTVRNVILGNVNSSSLNMNLYSASPVNITFSSSEYNYTNPSLRFNGYEFNAHIQLPAGLSDCSYMFYDCSNFNQSVNFPDTVTNFYGLFSNCQNYNKTVNIPDSVTNCVEMFSNCTLFNQPINIPDSVKNCAYMFYNCLSFNQQVTLPDYVKNCYSMFYNCQRFNQPVNIPNTSDYEALAHMFHNCYNFNQHVNIPNGVINCYEMFSNCFNLNQSIVFPASVNNMYNACWNCLNISDIYIYCNNNVNVTNLVGGDRINAARNVNIHCANLAIINKTSYGVYPSISWDANLYNSKYKIQLTTVM